MFSPRRRSSNQEERRKSLALGRQAEELAAAHLREHGYRVLARNYQWRGGEIDLIAEEQDHLVFVEVRSCATRAHGDPLETVNWAKRRHIVRTAQHYIEGLRGPLPRMRFDVVAIVFAPAFEIQLVRNAFETTASW